jgi:hypothetical protein
MPVDLTGIKPTACGAGSLLQHQPSINDRLPPAAIAPDQQHPGCAQRTVLSLRQVAGGKTQPSSPRLRGSAANPIPSLVRVCPCGSVAENAFSSGLIPSLRLRSKIKDVTPKSPTSVHENKIPCFLYTGIVLKNNTRKLWEGR